MWRNVLWKHKTNKTEFEKEEKVQVQRAHGVHGGFTAEANIFLFLISALGGNRQSPYTVKLDVAPSSTFPSFVCFWIFDIIYE